MTRGLIAGLTVAVAAVLAPPGAAAQRLELTLSPRVITFPSSDPDAVPAVAAPPVQVSYRVRQNDRGAPWSVTVLAGGDLVSGPAVIAISSVSWIATPAPPFQDGTLSKTVAQRIASGTGNVNPAATGSITFRLANSWTYNTGTYTQTVLFTLSAP
jgi:hypothetical protein